MPYLEVIDFLNRNIWYVVLAVAVVAAAAFLLVSLRKKRRASDAAAPSQHSVLPTGPVKKVKLSLVKKNKVEKPSAPPPPEPKYRDLHDIEEEIRRDGEIVVFKDSEGKFRFKLRTADFVSIAFSGTYNSKFACVQAIKHIEEIGSAQIIDAVRLDIRGYRFDGVIGRPCYEVYVDENGKCRFRLRTANLEVIITGLAYVNKHSAYQAVRRVNYIINNHKLCDTTMDAHADSVLTSII